MIIIILICHIICNQKEETRMEIVKMSNPQNREACALEMPEWRVSGFHRVLSQRKKLR